MPTLAELVTPRSLSTLRDELLGRLQAAGLAVTDWTEGGTERTLVEVDAKALAELELVAADIAAGGLLDYATGAWLTLLADNKFSITREPATFAEHQVVLTDAANTGPHTVTAGTLWVATATGLRFVSITGGTLTLGGTLTIQVRAEESGAAYDVAPAAIAVLVTALPGVTVSNPAIGMTGSSLTSPGADEESDVALRARCRDRWAELGSGSTAGAYRNWALAASSDVSEAVAVDTGTDTGTVDLILAGPSGPVSGGVVSTVQAYVDARVPLTVAATVRSATGVDLTITATLYGNAPDETTATAAATTAVEALIRSLGIGGKVYVAAVISALMAAGVKNVVMSLPAADVTIADNEVAVLSSLNLTWSSI